MSAKTTFQSERLVTGLLMLAIVFGAWQLILTIEGEFDRPQPHWANPQFDQLQSVLGDADEVVFLTDKDGLPSANGRIHSCQFAMIPARLIVKHTLLEAFAEIGEGKWCVMDVANPDSIDKAESDAKKWTVAQGRALIFKRLGPRLALFRSPPTQNGAAK